MDVRQLVQSLLQWTRNPLVIGSEDQRVTRLSCRNVHVSQIIQVDWTGRWNDRPPSPVTGSEVGKRVPRGRSVAHLESTCVDLHPELAFGKDGIELSPA
jgi:hypothetical protein